MSTKPVSKGSSSAGGHGDSKPKSKGKGKAAEEVIEDEGEDNDDEDEDEDDSGEEEENEEEEEGFEEIDPSVIQGRRTRGIRVDYTSQEALAKAGLKEDDEADDEEDVKL